MTSAPTHSEADTPAAWARPYLARQIDRLDRLAEGGLEIAEQVVRLAKDAWDVAGVHLATLAHTRVARAVRLTLMLQARLIKALEDWDRSAARADDAGGRTTDRVTEAFEQKQRVAGIIARIAEEDRDESDEVEGLVREAAERLDQEDLQGDILARPVSELVAAICKDLGLDPDWPRLAEEAWARDEMAGDSPGWPLAGIAGDGAAAPIRLRRRGSSP
jgi:hypothetical protein